MTATMRALELGALQVVPARAEQSRALLGVLRVSAAASGATNEESEAEALIAILADALEAIADCTPDPSAHAIAREALSMFYGR